LWLIKVSRKILNNWVIGKGGLVIGFWVLVAGNLFLVAGFLVLVAGYLILVAYSTGLRARVRDGMEHSEERMAAGNWFLDTLDS